jgi:hypothetical protein
VLITPTSPLIQPFFKEAAIGLKFFPIRRWGNPYGFNMVDDNTGKGFGDQEAVPGI